MKFYQWLIHLLTAAYGGVMIYLLYKWGVSPLYSTALLFILLVGIGPFTYFLHLRNRRLRLILKNEQHSALSQSRLVTLQKAMLEVSSRMLSDSSVDHLLQDI